MMEDLLNEILITELQLKKSYRLLQYQFKHMQLYAAAKTFAMIRIYKKDILNMNRELHSFSFFKSLAK